MSRLIELRVSSFQRVRAATIRPDGHVVTVSGRNDQGKQQPVSEPVLTPTGWRTMGALKAGDFVIGANGQPTEVVWVFPQTERRTFLVTMHDGGTTRCGPDHLWRVNSWKSGAGGESNRVEETLSTAALLERGLRRNSSDSHRKWAIQPVKPVAFADLGEDLPIDPYTLGVILGDGHIEPTGYVTITSWDAELLNGLGVDGWRTERELGSGKWSRPLRHLGLADKQSYEKFIPPIYFRASVEDRMALLHGLMDTDGTAEQSWASFCTTSPRLAADFVHLAGSLGFVAKRREGKIPAYAYKGERKEGRMAWVIGLKSPDAPFRLERKITRWRPAAQRPDILRRIDSIVEVEPEDSVCISVAAEDGLYITKDFIVTHNTSLLRAIWVLLEGLSAAPAKLIREGAEECVLFGDFGEIKVERTFTRGEDGGDMTHTLRVTDGDGKPIRKSPQGTLDKLLGAYSFDPLSFARQKAKDQYELLKGLVPGVDFNAIAGKRQKLFEERTEANRKATQAKGAAAAIQLPPGSAPKDTDITKESAALTAATAANAAADQERQRRERMASDTQVLADRARTQREEIDRLRAQAAALEAETLKVEASVNASRLAIGALPAVASAIDTAPIIAKIADAQRVKEVRGKFEERRRHLDAVEDAEAESDALSKQIEALDQEKADAIAAAKMPVAGLGFGDNEILLNDIPFTQAGTRVKIITSAMIAMALNPSLRIMTIDEGSEIDSEGMKLLEDLAKERDYTVILARVDEHAKSGFVMEDGTLTEIEGDVA